MPVNNAMGDLGCAMWDMRSEMCDENSVGAALAANDVGEESGGDIQYSNTIRIQRPEFTILRRCI